MRTISTILLHVDGLEIKTKEGKAKVLAVRLENVFSNGNDSNFKEAHFNEINKKINEDKVDSF